MPFIPRTQNVTAILKQKLPELSGSDHFLSTSPVNLRRQQALILMVEIYIHKHLIRVHPHRYEVFW